MATLIEGGMGTVRLSEAKVAASVSEKVVPLVRAAVRVEEEA